MLNEIIQANPRTSIIIIALGISLFISLINYFVLDKEKVRATRTKQKELSEQIKLHKHDAEKSMALQKELAANAMESMKHSFKPMIITLIPIGIAFIWIKGVFHDTSIAGSWFWYYFLSAIFGSVIFRKLLKLP